MENKPWFVYIVEAENGHLYTGITTDLERRFNQHQSKQGGARFFHTSAAKKSWSIKKHNLTAVKHLNVRRLLKNFLENPNKRLSSVNNNLNAMTTNCRAHSL
jgi:predicted GIY-YIG superfamily endonuclease